MTSDAPPRACSSKQSNRHAGEAVAAVVAERREERGRGSGSAFARRGCSRWPGALAATAIEAAADSERTVPGGEGQW